MDFVGKKARVGQKSMAFKERGELQGSSGDSGQNRSNSMPPADHFSGSMFINDIWKVLKSSHAEILKNSMIKEEDEERNREFSLFSNISEDIQKLLQSSKNSYLHVRKNSEGSAVESFINNPENPSQIFYIRNSMKMDRIISDPERELQTSMNLSYKPPMLVQNNSTSIGPNVYNQNVLQYLSMKLVANPAKKLAEQNTKPKENPITVPRADDEFSSSKAKNARHMARDQQGSRLLQKWISLGNHKIIDEIFANIKQDFIELMIDPFGNYLCQKILEVISQDDVSYVAMRIKEKIVLISHNQHGTRTVQKLIEVVRKKEMIEVLVEALKDDVITLSKDVNGNHVIQKCLQHWTPQQNQFIFESVMIKCVELCCNEIACRVIQRCLERGTRFQKEDLITLIVGNTEALILNQFGNYVITRILELDDVDLFKRDIVAIITDCNDFVSFIRHKFASKVIEKCLEVGDPAFENKLTDVLTEDKVLPSMISDQFANYVVQSSLCFCSESNRQRILHKMLQNSKEIRATEFGNMIYQKLALMFPILNLADSIENNGKMGYPLPHYYNNNMLAKTKKEGVGFGKKKKF